MQVLIGILVLAAIAAVVLRGKGSRFKRGRRIKCDGCRHLRRKFDDGVMCGYGSREVFKTSAHIRMCGDWQAAERRR